MRDPRPNEQQLNDLLEGKLGEPSLELERLRKLASAIAPASRPAPSAQFRERLRNELLARASETEEDVFAAFLDGMPFPIAPEVKQLVAVAAALEPASLPVPNPAFRYQLRNQLIDEAEHGAVSPGRRALGRIAAINERMRRSLRTVMATGVLAAVIAGSGATMAAASNALPGDALYPVKLFRESAQLAFASGQTDGFRRLAFARERMSELKGLEDRGSTNAGLYIATLDRMDSLTQQGAETLIDAARAGAGASVLRSVRSFAAVQEQDLRALLPQMPVAAQPFARDSLVELTRVTTTVKEILSGCPCNPPSNPLTPKSTSDGSSGSVGCSCDATQQTDQTGSGNTTTTGGSSTESNTDSTSPETTSPNEPDQTPVVDVPEIPGTELDNQVEDLVDQILTSPSPLPSLDLPSLPIPSLSVDDLNLLP